MSAESTPIDIADFTHAVSELPDDTVVSVRKQVETSLVKLKSTNDQLQQEIDKSPDSEDALLYKSVIKENEEVLRNQTQRMEAIDAELIKRGFKLEEDQGKESEKEDGNVGSDGVYL